VDEFVKVARLEDIPAGEPLGVETLDGEKIVLVKVDDAVYAFQDRCSHRDFPLSSGMLDGDQIECAWHGARFDVKTGKALSLPAIKSVRIYDVKIEDGDVYVAVEQD
jgi:3-phenylpropionate/trans-cinnamate dioxygenase ferredoxin component